MMPGVSTKVKLTPSGAPPVRQNTWRREADKYDDGSIIQLCYLCFISCVDTPTNPGQTNPGQTNPGQTNPGQTNPGHDKPWT
jgi:hypothetical protein